MNLGVLQTALTFVLIFTTLVFFHELGHFLVAKLFKMNVEEFAIGMGPRLIRLFHDGQTEYNIRAFPIGGFVRIKGMEVEDAVERRLTGGGPEPAIGSPSTTTLYSGFRNTQVQTEMNRALEGMQNADHKSEFTTTNTGTLEQEASDVSGADPNGFNSRPIFQRFSVILAGPVFSFLLGWLTLCLIGVITGLPDKVQVGVGSVLPGSVAQQVGLKTGDIILSVNGKPATDGEATLLAIRNSAGKPITFTVRADAAKDSPVRTITATPRAEKDTDGKTVGRLGFTPTAHALTMRRLSLAESFQFGNSVTAGWFRTMGQLVASGAIKNSVGGPIAIIKETAGATKRGGADPLMLLGQLSLSLGLFNLLPIPVLDGGHLTLMGLEAIRGRKLTAEQTGRVLTAGLAVLAVITVLVLFKDIRGLF